MSGGVLVRVVFVQMVFVRGGFCPTPAGGLSKLVESHSALNSRKILT